MTEAGNDANRAQGRCHCGAVEFSVRGPLRDVIICHCEDCRRIHGHAAAHSAAKWDDLAISGEDDLVWYASSARARRGFCGRCGSGLFYDLLGRDIVSICAGALDQPTKTEIALHIFEASAADYEATGANVPHHDDFPAGARAIQFS